MTQKMTIGFILLASTYLSSPVAANMPDPTFDTLKEQAAALSENYILTESTGTLPDGAVEVTIGEKKYHFLPQENSFPLLSALSETPAGSLIETSDGIFEAEGKKYAFNIAHLPDSAYSFVEGNKDDYNFTIQETDETGQLVTRYYKVNINTDALSSAQNISWQNVGENEKNDPQVISVTLPNNRVNYLKYTYSQPENRTVYNSRQTALNGDQEADFVNSSHQAADNVQGGAVYNQKTLGNLTGSYIGNSVKSTGGTANGGAVYNLKSQGRIGRITGDFIANRAESTGGTTNGGAVNNNGTITAISGNFIGNYAENKEGKYGAYGGALYTNGVINEVAGNFVGNHVSGNNAYGGGVYNYADIGSLTGDFIGNHAESINDRALGGALSNYYGIIGSLTGDFIGNHITSTKGDAYGGAVYNYGYSDNGRIDSITGNFIGNYVENPQKYANGGAIYNSSSIGDINGDFIGNYVKSPQRYAVGGAIYNYDTIGNINGSFRNNYAFGKTANAGAIYNYGNIGDITGDFVGNYVQTTSKEAFGGAVYNQKNIKSISGSFLGNHADDGTNPASGGAVYTSSDMTFTSGGENRFFSGNYTKDKLRGKNYNAVFVNTYSSSPVITFDTTGGGAWIINDNIEGGRLDFGSVEINYGRQYNLAFKGDGVLNEDGLTDQYVAINNDVINAGEVTVEGTTLRFGAYQHEDKTAHNWDGHGRFLAALKADGTADLDAEAVTSLSLNNAAFDLYNKYQDMVNLKGWKASGDSFLHVDVDVENLTADMLNVNGNVEGTTRLVLYPTSDKDIRGESILFAQSTNDTTGNADSFKVWRVYRSPYMFETKYTKTGENANKWELEMNDTVNPDADQKPDERPDPEVPDIKPTPTPDKPTNPVYGEVVAYGALPAAAIEQTRSVVDNVFGQTAGRRSYCPGCGFYDYYWNGEGFRNLWINPTYYTSNIDSPFDVDADVWGIEAGGDLQHDLNNKLGLFVSYRKGSYDMNGDGKHYYSTVGSEIDIDSYLAGLYYRYDRNNWYAFATLYGGIQQADIKTDDGIKSDTDGVEFGASLEAGYDYNLTDTVYLTPSLGVFYTQVNYDDATDNVGKKAEYNDLKQIELEAGVKLTKAFRLDEGYANVYVKPSVVQTLVDGDEVNITGLGKVNTLDDETLGRIEFGGRYGFTDQLSAYGWANYTFGSDYDATTVGLGLNYAF